MATIDLTTLSGWDNLADGTYDITVGAKATGYPRVKQSSAVSVTKTTPPPQEGNYVRFSSANSFSLNKANSTKDWDGTLEYSTDGTIWNTFNATDTINSASDGTRHNIYLRGIGNTQITGSGTGKRFNFTGTGISANGNIENLLDYATVALGNHPPMANYCYRSLFANCTNLTDISNLVLGATTLTAWCYQMMFRGTGISYVSNTLLPATTMKMYCYSYLFAECTNLTTLQENCLPATTLASNCYENMFYGCTSLTKLPTNLLPATTMAYMCYAGMFTQCSNLTYLPKLPATTLDGFCYQNMFSYCFLVGLSATQADDYTTPYRIPYEGTATDANNSTIGMFSAAGVSTPSINTTYYTKAVAVV
jgi:hypothetical protein